MTVTRIFGLACSAEGSPVVMNIETLRAGYGAYGLGAAEAMLAMFDRDSRGGAEWNVGHQQSPVVARAQLAPYDLFGGEDDRWDIVRVEPKDFERRADRIIVTGHVFWRPRRGWHTVAVPFLHIWTLRERHPVKVVSYLDGIELCRVESDSGWR